MSEQGRSDEPPLPAALWETLRRDPPDRRAIDRAYARFVAGPRPRLVQLGLWRWLAAGFVAGWGVVFAATGDPLFGARLYAHRVRVEPPRVTSNRAEPRVASSRMGVAAAEDVAAVATSDTASATAAVGEPPSAASASARRSAPALVPGAVSERATVDPKWQRVAEALRLHDYASAEAALAELEGAGSAADREAASLSLAQVLIARGRGMEARARLERLAGSARAGLVRDKAESLLADLSSRADRSESRGADTHRP